MGGSDTVSDIAGSPGSKRANQGHGDMLLAISNAMVRLYKDHYGKGPTKARTYHQEDVITCVLRGGLTRAEQTLLAAGHPDAVRRGRHMLQSALREDFVEAVETLTGRRVIGFMSGNAPEADMSVEVFVLESAEPASTSE